MPDTVRHHGRIPALITVAVLATMGVAIALLGASPARVSATELLGDARSPGEAAFVAGHRGDSASAPENTLPAIERALAGGFDYVEVDVALTRDGHPVLMHDRTVDRTTNGHGRLASLTLEEVRALDAGSWFDPAFAGTQVPMFTEFLDVLERADGRALIELKGEWTPEATASLVHDIEARGLERDVAVASFDARILAWVATSSEVISRLANMKTLPDDVVSAARTLGVRGIVADGRAVAERPEIIDELHAQGMRVVVYTLNDDVQWHEATALGVDGIVTDAPASLVAWQDAAAP